MTSVARRPAKSIPAPLRTPAVMWISGLTGAWPLLSWLSFTAALPALRRILTQSGAALVPALGETARLQAVFGLLFALGLYLG